MHSLSPCVSRVCSNQSLLVCARFYWVFFPCACSIWFSKYSITPPISPCVVYRGNPWLNTTVPHSRVDATVPVCHDGGCVVLLGCNCGAGGREDRQKGWAASRGRESLEGRGNERVSEFDAFMPRCRRLVSLASRCISVLCSFNFTYFGTRKGDAVGRVWWT